MSAGAVAELWADLIGEPAKLWPASALAKDAKAANRKHCPGTRPESAPGESLRISANGERVAVAGVADSQEFADIRKPANGAASEQPSGLSQDSKDSQGCTDAIQNDLPSLDLAAVAWTDADISAFLERRTRLLRWGWAEPEAEKLAERLVKRDREQGDRVSCADCRHYRPGRCGNHQRAGLNVADVGRDLAAMLQRCPGFALRVDT